MKSWHEGELVTIVGEAGTVDGIVVHAPSLVSVDVAFVDAEHGALFRTVHPKTLRARTHAGEHDDALRRLLRRGASTGGAGQRSGAGYGRRGHSRASGHRTTGK
jgi:hypothetical protein